MCEEYMDQKYLKLPHTGLKIKIETPKRYGILSRFCIEIFLIFFIIFKGFWTHFFKVNAFTI